MNARREENDRETEGERERKKREWERNHGVGGRTRTHHYRLTYWKNREPLRTYAHRHCAVANFLLHFNVWSYQTAHTSIYTHAQIYFARLTIIYIMIVHIIAIFFLQFVFPLTTAYDLSNNRYNSLISAQCKARCLYEYRNHHHQQRSVPSMFNNGKTKRLLVRSKKEAFFNL